MRPILLAAALALAACTSASARARFAGPPLILSGEITRANHQTYLELPFETPAGVNRITIDFAYTNKENRTVIDIGLRDPQGQRGWSGGNKSHIEIAASEATPSYRPGPIPPGEWKLILGVPNIREGQTSHYEARIAFNTPEPHQPARAAAPPAGPLPPGRAGWLRGDFHTHTAHSDGACDTGSGIRSPCPVMLTAIAAAESHLDFVAITDHNTISQLADIRAMQGAYQGALLIPGTEVTTFFGHANAIGVSDFVDFQLGSARLPTLSKLLDEVEAEGAILSVNHPALPSGEVCMGCGWTVKETDWSRITAIEVVNGSALRSGGAEGPTSGIRFWDTLLKQGYRLTAIGGSDNHDATDRAGEKQSPVGAPATVVHAADRSIDAIIDAVRSGRAFVDVAGLPGLVLDMQAQAGPARVDMGGLLRLARAQEARITISLSRLPAGARINLVTHNVILGPSAEAAASLAVSDQARLETRASLKPGEAAGYVRPEVRDERGRLLLLGNPVYLRAA